MIFIPFKKLKISIRHSLSISEIQNQPMTKTNLYRRKVLLIYHSLFSRSSLSTRHIHRESIETNKYQNQRLLKRTILLKSVNLVKLVSVGPKKLGLAHPPFKRLNPLNDLLFLLLKFSLGCGSL